MISSAARGQPPRPSRSDRSPACIAAPRVSVGSWQCCMKARPEAAVADRTRDIIPAEAMQSPSSEMPAAPALASRAISVSSSPLRPRVAAATAKTRHGEVAFARAWTNSTNSGESSAGDVLGMQQTVVKPPATAAAPPVAMVSLCSCPGSRRCTCGSMSPGTTRHPLASMTRAPLGTCSRRPMARTRPPSMATSAASSRPEAGSITRPPRMTRASGAWDGAVLGVGAIGGESRRAARRGVARWPGAGGLGRAGPTIRGGEAGVERERRGD